MLNPLYMIQMLLNFFVLMGLLTYLLYKPVRKVMAERSAGIERALNDAALAREEAESMRQTFASEMAQARATSQRIIEEATKHGQKIKDELVAEAREEGVRIVQRAQAEVQHEVGKAMAMLKDHVLDLTISSAAAVIGREINPVTHRQLISDTLQGMGRQ